MNITPPAPAVYASLASLFPQGSRCCCCRRRRRVFSCAHHRVGIDPRCISHNIASHIKSNLASSSSTLIPLLDNPIDAIWSSERPALPLSTITIMPDTTAGCSAAEKIKRVQLFLSSTAADAIVISALDDVAWLTNMRGADINYNPVFFSFALVTPSSATLYVMRFLQCIIVTSCTATSGGSSTATPYSTTRRPLVCS